MEKKMTVEEIEKERAFSHWLCNIEGIGRKTIRKLLTVAENAQEVYGMGEERLAGLLRPAQLHSLLEKRGKEDVREAYAKLEKKGIIYCPFSDPFFPSRLRQIPDPPAGLYVRGGLPEEAAPAVAVVGARACSEYGKYTAGYFASALAQTGVNVISGMARGVDGISQRAALESGGKTFAVMGCGVDICYPPENGPLYEKLQKQGGVLSEYPPGTRPLAGYFPQRNRIISGLADLILVVEARERSGSLITVDMALEQGKEVYAVPGRVTDRLSMGCNRLIRQGAGIAVSPEAVLEELDRLTTGSRCVETKTFPFEKEESAQSLPDKEESLERAVEKVLDFSPRSPGQIADSLENAGVTVELPVLLQALMELVLRGKCGQEGGCFYRKA